jgi:DNA-directed RNA polymerase subunit RPC12/RpoP
MDSCENCGNHICNDCYLRESLQEKVEELEQWVKDLQSGMYINCVYCGHRYGPNDEVPASMADVLKEHVKNCPKHPMYALRKCWNELRRRISRKDSMSGCFADVLDLMGKLEKEYGLEENS